MDMEKKNFPYEHTPKETAAGLSLKILQCCRNELYSLYPYMDGAFASLEPCCTGDTQTMGTDGERLLFSPQYVTDIFLSDGNRLRHSYLHLLLHCLFLHPFRRGDIQKADWDIAADMAVEQVLWREGHPRLSLPEQAIRETCFAMMGERALSAEEICGLLCTGAFPFSREELRAAFLMDDHHLWDKADPHCQEVWRHILQYTGGGKSKRGGRAGTQSGNAEEKLDSLPAGTYDYRKYLRRFAVPREEMELDMDSFDQIYYHLGMERYGNLPLIEPLEYKEGHKLEELVIAIDTSGSCSKEVVSRFLAETYSILSAQENFFRRFTVYLIQCDCLVQSVAVIHSGEEWKNYSRGMTIQGRGGTDFTPVFRYVDRLRQEGKLKKLRALLYFTDGDGFYPREKTEYKTAFVFLQKSQKMDAVPKWADVLLISR